MAPSGSTAQRMTLSAWVGENEEEARRNAARGSLPRSKAMSLSPWLNKEQVSRELEYHSDQNGEAGVND